MYFKISCYLQIFTTKTCNLRKTLFGRQEVLFLIFVRKYILCVFFLNYVSRSLGHFLYRVIIWKWTCLLWQIVQEKHLPASRFSLEQNCIDLPWDSAPLPGYCWTFCNWCASYYPLLKARKTEFLSSPCHLKQYHYNWVNQL